MPNHCLSITDLDKLMVGTALQTLEQGQSLLNTTFDRGETVVLMRINYIRTLILEVDLAEGNKRLSPDYDDKDYDNDPFAPKKAETKAEEAFGVTTGMILSLHERLQEQLHKEKNSQVALENKAELEELALVEAYLANLEWKVDEIGVRLNELEWNHGTTLDSSIRL
ncbi:hypothetical protein JHK82_024995 [Glycine max]|nr:hypothetical protein JHK85_025612 [Glycine max]KAG5012854.1 hypothetical protein JHK86_025115 [Glycine max]KAG5133807.1 hypothetical protein JHK82_024995 [Glycine max]